MLMNPELSRNCLWTLEWRKFVVEKMVSCAYGCESRDGIPMMCVEATDLLSFEGYCEQL